MTNMALTAQFCRALKEHTMAKIDTDRIRNAQIRQLSEPGETTCVMAKIRDTMATAPQNNRS